MNKRGVEMSLQTVVIAVILLLIAALLIYMVSSKLGAFNNAIQDCTSKGGSCMESCQPGTFPTGVCSDGEICCASGEGLFGDR